MGPETARASTRRESPVILTCRSPHRLERAVDEVERAEPQGRVGRERPIGHDRGAEGIVQYRTRGGVRLRGGAQRQQALTDAVRYLGKRRLEHTGCQANADRAGTRVRQQLNRGL